MTRKKSKLAELEGQLEQASAHIEHLETQLRQAERRLADERSRGTDEDVRQGLVTLLRFAAKVADLPKASRQQAALQCYPEARHGAELLTKLPANQAEVELAKALSRYLGLLVIGGES